MENVSRETKGEKMKKIFEVAFIIMVSAFLSSCMGEEPNDIAYVTAIGIDKEDEGYLYTIQFANPTKISGGASEEGGSGGNIVETIAVEAPTVYVAISNANAIVSKDLSLSHAKVIAISEEIAKDGIWGITDVISRNNEIRPDVYFTVAENSGEYIQSVKPVIELNPVKYYQLTYENKNGDTVPQNTADDFYMACISGDRDFVLPLSGTAETMKIGTINTASENDEKPDKNKANYDVETNKELFQYGRKNYFAGEAGTEIKNKSETIGLAVFKGDTYVGKMGSLEAEIYNILSCSISRSRVTFYTDSKREVPIVVTIEEKKKPHIKLNQSSKTAEVEIVLEAELVSVPEKNKDISEEEFNSFASDAADSAIEGFLNKSYKEMNVDMLGIKSKLKRKFITNEKYYEYIKDFEPKEWDFSVNTNFRLKRTGMTYYN